MDNAAILPARYGLDVDDYHRMGEAGILHEDSRVELIDGELIEMAPIGQFHASVVGRLTQVLVLACRGRAIVWPQNPVRLDSYNEPQPDFALLRPRADFYATGERAGPADTLLLIEVADSSLRYDRRVKLPLYARAGIPEYWIVDLKARTVEVHRQPSPEGYDSVATPGPGTALALAQDSEIVVDLDRVFG